MSEDAWYEMLPFYDGADIEIWDRECGDGEYTKNTETTTAMVSPNFIFGV